MPIRALYNFYFRFGPARLAQVLEILNDGNPAPQQRIARLLGISKSRVSMLLRAWIVWHAEFRDGLAEEAKLLLDFDAHRVRESKDRFEVISQRAKILHLRDERNRRA